jgi:transposase
MIHEALNQETSIEMVSIPKPEYETLKALKEQNAELSQQVNWLMEQMRLARHRQFGSSSEKSEYDQINFFNEAEANAGARATELELTVVEKHYRRKAAESKDRLPPDLPVEVVEHTLPEEEQVCPACGEALHVMGRETRRELKLIPAQAVIVEHVQYVYSCRACEKNACAVPVVKAPAAAPVIRGSFASPEAVAHIMTQKYVSGVPLYRQEQEFERNGIGLSRQTMSNWIVKCSQDWLEPIYGALHEMLCRQKILHADETTLQVLHEPGKAAQTDSYMWLYRTSGDTKMPIVLLDYQPDRKKTHPAEFLKGFKGYLHTDGYSGYHGLPDEIIIVGCWAHARRKFDEALKGLLPKDQAGSLALKGKQYCDRLFAFERTLEDCTLEERYRKRQGLAKPVMDEFFSWLSSLRPAPKTGLGKAVHYTLEQWNYLKRYLLDGRLEISNNRAERSIKPFVIDRKNFLFANTSGGAKASAITFSIIETAIENGLNPYAYLTYIFKNAPNWDIRNNPDALQKLLPEHAHETCRASAWAKKGKTDETDEY